MSESRVSAPQPEAAVRGGPPEDVDEAGSGPLRTVPLVPEPVVTEDPADVAHRIVEEVLAEADLAEAASPGPGVAAATAPEVTVDSRVSVTPEAAAHPDVPATATVGTPAPRPGVAPGSAPAAPTEAVGPVEGVAGAASPRRWLLVSLLAAVGLVVTLVLGVAALRGVVEGQLALLVPALGIGGSRRDVLSGVTRGRGSGHRSR